MGGCLLAKMLRETLGWEGQVEKLGRIGGLSDWTTDGKEHRKR